MNYILIGKIVNTHGIKGEVKIISDFKYKDEVIKSNKTIYIGNKKEAKIIKTKRIHKNLDMITFTDITDINEVLKYKNEWIYIDKNELDSKFILDEDIIGFEIYEKDSFIGILEDISKSLKYDYLVINVKGNNKLVPYISEFVKNIDIKNKRIEIKTIKGLIDED